MVSYNMLLIFSTILPTKFSTVLILELGDALYAFTNFTILCVYAFIFIMEYVICFYVFLNFN
eukprot:SAG11_NODE_199_length_12635_cov_104.801771_4_plen_62_part_00